MVAGYAKTVIMVAGCAKTVIMVAGYAKRRDRPLHCAGRRANSHEVRLEYQGVFKK